MPLIVSATTVSILSIFPLSLKLTHTSVENGLVFADSWERCVQACDMTVGCVDVSWVSEIHGACYMKSSIGEIHKNSNIQGGRKISGCSKVKLHRKRVVSVEPRQQRHVFKGPDYTIVPDVSTVTFHFTLHPTLTE